MKLKKDIYDKLQALLPEITEKIVKNQVKNSINLMAQQSDFMQILTPEEVKSQISNTENEI